MYKTLCAVLLACVACSTATLGEDGLMCTTDDRDLVAFDSPDRTEWIRGDPVSAVEAQVEGYLPEGSTLEVGEGSHVMLLNRRGQPVADFRATPVNEGYVADTYTSCPGVLPFGG